MILYIWEKFGAQCDPRRFGAAGWRLAGYLATWLAGRLAGGSAGGWLAGWLGDHENDDIQVHQKNTLSQQRTLTVRDISKLYSHMNYHVTYDIILYHIISQHMLREGKWKTQKMLRGGKFMTQKMLRGGKFMTQKMLREGK